MEPPPTDPPQLQDYNDDVDLAAGNSCSRAASYQAGLTAMPTEHTDSSNVASRNVTPVPVGQIESLVHDASYVDKRERKDATRMPRGQTFNMRTPDDLLKNATTEALMRTQSCSSNTSVLLEALRERQGPNVLDWNRQKNRRKLKELRQIIRNLFWAFEEVEHQAEAQVTKRNLPAWRRIIQSIVISTSFSTFFLLLTIYALFGPDVAEVLGHTPQSSSWLGIFNTFVLGFFIIECVLNSINSEGYFCQLRFWIDTFAAFSIIGDTIFIDEIVKSDAAVAVRGSRLIRLIRLGGRSTRLVRLLRLARTVQILRLIPKIQEWMERGTNELAFLLWHKRIRHLFKYLDKSGYGKLEPEEIEIFHTAMAIEFPGKLQLQDPQDAPLGWVNRNLHYIKRAASTVASGLSRTSALRGSQLESAGPEGTYSQVVSVFIADRVGKRSFQRCVDDICCMKESCAIVERAIARLTLKVCVLVLLLLVTMQLLSTTDLDYDFSTVQGINQLDIMTDSPEGLTPQDYCNFVQDEYVPVVRDSHLLLLVLDHRVYWRPGCHCCDPAEAAASEELVTNPCGSASCEAGEIPEEGSLVDGIIKSTGRSWHEFSIAVVMNGNEVRSLALWDMHLVARESALYSLFSTLAVVVLLSVLVVYFATDMKRLSNSNVLHPLWDLMDDMCALKSIEVLGEPQRQAGGGLRRSSTRNLVSMLVAEQKKRWCTSCVARCVGAPVPVAEELLNLRNAFDKLHVAMLSWSKYVPMVLLKQLFEAQVEANLGVVREEVCVFFCALKGFQELTGGLRPRETLHLMSSVLTGIYNAIEDNGGIMLEFIGDEVLAIFNAPLRLPDPEMCAVNAAIEAQDAMAECEYADMNLRLVSSVHKAKVLAGNLGSPTRMKYGVLGDGVNLCARLKGLNSRYGTSILISGDVLIEDKTQSFVMRPVGNLILKGRTTPTAVREVLGKTGHIAPELQTGAEKQQKAFDLFVHRRFEESKALFREAHDLIRPPVPTEDGDRLTNHLIGLCDKYLAEPPPKDWDGSEKLTKKAW